MRLTRSAAQRNASGLQQNIMLRTGDENKTLCRNNVPVTRRDIYGVYGNCNKRGEDR